MSYALDPELAESAASIPEFSIIDSAVPLDIRDLRCSGDVRCPGHPRAVYAPPERDGLLPGLL